MRIIKYFKNQLIISPVILLFTISASGAGAQDCCCTTAKASCCSYQENHLSGKVINLKRTCTCSHKYQCDINVNTDTVFIINTSGNNIKIYTDYSRHSIPYELFTDNYPNRAGPLILNAGFKNSSPIFIINRNLRI